MAAKTSGKIAKYDNFPIFQTAADYNNLYRYVKALNEIIAKNGQYSELTRRLGREPSFASSSGVISVDSINQSIHRNKFYSDFDLEGVSRAELSRYGNFALQLGAAKERPGNVPSLDDVDEARKKYFQMRGERESKALEDKTGIEGKINGEGDKPGIKKELSEARGEQAKHIVGLVLGGGAAAAVTGGLGASALGIITAGGSLAAAGPVIAAVTLVVGGAWALPRFASFVADKINKIKEANQRRKAKKKELKQAKKELKRSKKLIKSLEKEFAGEDAFLLHSPYPGKGASEISSVLGLESAPEVSISADLRPVPEEIRERGRVTAPEDETRSHDGEDERDEHVETSVDKDEAEARRAAHAETRREDEDADEDAAEDEEEEKVVLPEEVRAKYLEHENLLVEEYAKKVKTKGSKQAQLKSLNKQVDALIKKLEKDMSKYISPYHIDGVALAKKLATKAGISMKLDYGFNDDGRVVAEAVVENTETPDETTTATENKTVENAVVEEKDKTSHSFDKVEKKSIDEEIEKKLTTESVNSIKSKDNKDDKIAEIKKVYDEILNSLTILKKTGHFKDASDKYLMDYVAKRMLEKLGDAAKGITIEDIQGEKKEEKALENADWVPFEIQSGGRSVEIKLPRKTVDKIEELTGGEGAELADERITELLTGNVEITDAVKTALEVAGQEDKVNVEKVLAAIGSSENKESTIKVVPAHESNKEGSLDILPAGSTETVEIKKTDTNAGAGGDGSGATDTGAGAKIEKTAPETTSLVNRFIELAVVKVKDDVTIKNEAKNRKVESLNQITKKLTKVSKTINKQGEVKTVEGLVANNKKLEQVKAKIKSGELKEFKATTLVSALNDKNEKVTMRVTPDEKKALNENGKLISAKKTYRLKPGAKKLVTMLDTQRIEEIYKEKLAGKSGLKKQEKIDALKETISKLSGENPNIPVSTIANQILTYSIATAGSVYGKYKKPIMIVDIIPEELQDRFNEEQEKEAKENPKTEGQIIQETMMAYIQGTGNQSKEARKENYKKAVEQIRSSIKDEMEQEEAIKKLNEEIGKTYKNAYSFITPEAQEKEADLGEEADNFIESIKEQDGALDTLRGMLKNSKGDAKKKIEDAIKELETSVAKSTLDAIEETKAEETEGKAVESKESVDAEESMVNNEEVEAKDRPAEIDNTAEITDDEIYTETKNNSEEAAKADDKAETEDASEEASEEEKDAKETKDSANTETSLFEFEEKIKTASEEELQEMQSQIERLTLSNSAKEAYINAIKAKIEELKANYNNKKEEPEEEPEM